MERGRPAAKPPLSASQIIDLTAAEDPPCSTCSGCGRTFSGTATLEQHRCPAAGYICSCGTEFALYFEMLEHSKIHEPGHAVVTRRPARRVEEEGQQHRHQQHKRLHPATLGHPALSILDTRRPGPMHRVPVRGNPAPTAAAPGLNKLLWASAAPCVDLWTLYQPVVLIKMRYRSKTRTGVTFDCGKCGKVFPSRKSLIAHYNGHILCKVFGCIGCGLLLSSTNSALRYHQCSAPVSQRAGIITARPMREQRTKVVPSPVAQKQFVSYNRSRELAVASPPQVFRRSSPNEGKKLSLTISDKYSLTCRICHTLFGTVQMLQRHKCVKAQEIMKRQTLAGTPSSVLFSTIRNPYPFPTLK